MSVEYLQGDHNFTGKSVPVFSHPWVKLVFLMFNQNFPCFCLCLLPLVLPLGTTEMTLAPSLLLLLSGVRTHW